MINPVIKIQLPAAYLHKLFPEGSEAEATLAAGTLANFSNEMAHRISQQIINQAGGISYVHHIEQKLLAASPSAYTKLSDTWKQSITANVEALVQDWITTEVNRVVETAKAGIQDRVERTIASMVGQELVACRLKIREALAEIVQQEVSTAQVTVAINPKKRK
jgi:hypothetical protein